MRHSCIKSRGLLVPIGAVIFTLVATEAYGQQTPTDQAKAIIKGFLEGGSVRAVHSAGSVRLVAVDRGGTLVDDVCFPFELASFLLQTIPTTELLITGDVEVNIPYLNGLGSLHRTVGFTIGRSSQIDQGDGEDAIMQGGTPNTIMWAIGGAGGIRLGAGPAPGRGGKGKVTTVQANTVGIAVGGQGGHVFSGEPIIGAAGGDAESTVAPIAQAIAIGGDGGGGARGATGGPGGNALAMGSDRGRADACGGRGGFGPNGVIIPGLGAIAPGAGGRGGNAKARVDIARRPNSFAFSKGGQGGIGGQGISRCDEEPPGPGGVGGAGGESGDTKIEFTLSARPPRGLEFSILAGPVGGPGGPGGDGNPPGVGGPGGLGSLSSVNDLAPAATPPGPQGATGSPCEP